MIRAQNNLSEEIRAEKSHDRSGQPDKHNVELQDAPEVHREITTLNTDNEPTRERIEEDMDFKIPGLPHSTVKQFQSATVRELIQKIENHPNRHALQRDVQQSQSFNPFSKESKQMIHEVGNIELCELLDTETQGTAQGMSIILEHWRRLLHVRALLSSRKRGESAIHQVYDGHSFNSRVRDQERTTSRTSIW